MLPRLEGERLTLRPYVADDAPELARLAGAPEVAYQTSRIPSPYPVADAVAWIAGNATRHETTGDVQLAIDERETGRLVGGIGLVVDLAHRHAVIGYWIARDGWGRGYATEAVRIMIDYGFGELDLHRIYACVFTQNPASRRVLEKVGMILEGMSPKSECRCGEQLDMWHFGMLRREWTPG